MGKSRMRLWICHEFSSAHLPVLLKTTGYSFNSRMWLSLRHPVLWSKCLALIKNMYILMSFVLQFVCLTLEERWSQRPWQVSCLLGKAFSQTAGGNWSCGFWWMVSYCTGVVLSLHIINSNLLRTVNWPLFKMPLCWNKCKASHSPRGIFLKSTSLLMAKMQDAKMGVSWGPDRCSQRLGAVPLGASIGLSLGPLKIMMIISFWDTSTESHGGSSGRVKVPGLAESGLSPALLRALHDHHTLEEPPADPGQKLTPEECAATAPAGRDLGLLSVISNSVAKSSGKFQRAEPEVGHLISIDF